MKNLLGFLAILAVSLAFSMPATDTNGPGEGLKVGDKAPDFKLQHVDGNYYSLSELGRQVKGFIVVFTCNTCPYAVKYEERIKKLHGKYADFGYPVIAVNPNDPSIKPGDSFEAMQERYRDHNFNFVYLFDKDQSVYPAFGATRTPQVYVLDNNRIVKYIGAIDNNPDDAESADAHYVDNAIQAIMKGEEPNPTFTKAIGCSIKAKKVTGGDETRQ